MCIFSSFLMVSKNSPINNSFTFVSIGERDLRNEMEVNTLASPNSREEMICLNCFALGGIVNLTRVWETGQYEKANTQLPASSFSF